MHLGRTLIVTALALTVAPSIIIAQKPAKPTHGVDLTRIDRSVKPGDSFYLYANGKWMQRTVIPTDRTSLDTFQAITDRTDKQVASIIEDAAKSSAPDTDARRIADLYHSYMDQAAIEHAGLTPLKSTLARIAALHDKRQLSGLLGSTLRADTDALNNTQFHTPNIFGLWVAPGFNDPDHYAPYLMQGGGELPNRDYCLDSSEHMQQVRTKYLAHLATLFRLAGFDHPDQRAQHVLSLETSLAKVQLSLADSEDVHKANNLWKVSDFATKAPGLDWSNFFYTASLSDQEQIYVWQPAAIAGESALVASAPLDEWKDWLALHAIEDNADYLPKAFADAHFAFFGTALTGATQQRPRNIRAIKLVNTCLGKAVGKLYAQRFFSPEAKAAAQKLVANLLAAYHKRLEAVTWMAPSTKAEALAKLSTLQVSVGYPDAWRTYAGLDIYPNFLLGNINRAKLHDYRYNLSRIGRPVNRKEWCMDPQTVNAVNLPLDNGLNFPAAVLQPPFFDPKAPDATNYGGIGTIIGHEISHTFDTSGANFDSKGRARNWWTPADFAHFNQVTSALAAQVDTYEPLPGLHVSGRQTLGEDIADLVGLNTSLVAFHAAETGKTPPTIGGYTPEQQFFLAFGQAWATKTRDAALRRQLLTDPHAPGAIRALTVRNLDAWYKDFNVQPGQKLYLPPDKRIRIW